MLRVHEENEDFSLEDVRAEATITLTAVNNIDFARNNLTVP